MDKVGSSALPLRVAIIGSGPSAFYAAEALIKQTDFTVQVDMFDRLPTPYGLVRGGVAPDHPKIKSVTKVYERIATSPNFRFYGNVEFGKDITHDEFKARYDQIIYAVGAQSDRHMGIPGENLPGSHAATEFVAWYNAHPDFRDLKFDLSQESVAVVGNGNVAMDVARILGSSYEELKQTDIADYALEALANSKVKEIYLLGRRGPAQAAFTNPELKELGELELVDVIALHDDVTPDPLSVEWLAKNPDASAEKNLKTLAQYEQKVPAGKPRRIHMRFLVSPVEIIGTDHVEAIKLVKNELYTAPDGSLRPRATDVTETVPVGLVFRSIGYKGVPLPGVPFDEKAAVIPNVEGRVIDQTTKQPVGGEYVVGWIKRGPTGIIGTNKPDAVDTVRKLLEDVPNLQPLDPAVANPVAVDAFIHSRKPDLVTFSDWLMLDQLELSNGATVGRPRLKFSSVEDMLSALQAQKQQQATPAAQVGVPKAEQ